MPRKPVVVSNWHKLYERFSTSSLEFYAAVEDAIKQREIPELKFSRVMWKESGVLSAKRQYLRIARGRLHWDICAAPFGTGFFFSSRLAVLPSRLAGLVYLLLFSAGSYTLLKNFGKPYYQGWPAWGYDTALVFAFFFILGTLVRMRAVGNEDSVLAMPIFGFLYEKLFNPQTYYKEDTDLMFRSTVDAAVLAAVEAVTRGKGMHVVPGVSQGDAGENAARSLAG